jgi:hypothetical protein
MIKPLLKSWSYSRLLDYERCPYALKLKVIDKLPVVQHTSAERGTTIHLQAEQFVGCEVSDKLPGTLSHFAEEFTALRRQFDEGIVSLEGEWGFDQDWMPVNYATAWLRMKLDAAVFLTPIKAVVIDYKTGRKDGNEIKHGEQVLLYAIATFIKFPKLKEVIVELWYLDKNLITTASYTRLQALRYVQTFHDRAMKMVTAITFPANPTEWACQWCDFGPAKGNQCPHGVAKGASPLTFYRNKFTDWTPPTTTN